MVHDVPPNEIPHSFAIVSLNRFQQIVAVHTLQAASDEAKVGADHKLIKYIVSV
jgi:hypothetical protein